MRGETEIGGGACAAAPDAPRLLLLAEARTADPWGDDAPARDALARGRFLVHGEARRLEPPIDWGQDPRRSRSWRYELHTLTWLRPALARHAATGDRGALLSAHAVVHDWAARHVDPDVGDPGEFAWYDMAVGLRAPCLAYVLRACSAAGLLDEDGEALLVAAAERHGDELADPQRYACGHNHGLYQDAGLYLLARQLPSLPQAHEWAQLAERRLWETLRATVAFDDGAHLEHSTAYQLAVVNLLTTLDAAGLPGLGTLLGRMRRTAAWQVAPGGRLAQLGDTDDVPAPAWARDAAACLHGLRALFSAGQAFVRDDGAYLAATAAHHGLAHKHADDSGFVLHLGGRPVLGDAGRWGYYENDPDRVYARSNRAHNVLAVDGQDLDWRWARPYGSGLLAAGEGDGWHAILLANRLLAQQGVAHLRLLLLRPDTGLIVVDAVRGERPAEHVRRFHFAPGLRAEVSAGAIGAGDGDFAVTLADCSADADVDFAVSRAVDDPHPLGWAYPADRERLPACVAELRTRAHAATYVATIALGPTPLGVIAASLTPGAATIELAAYGGACVAIRFVAGTALPAMS